MIENYFNPASHLINCELNQIKRSDALIILSYLTLIAPAVILCIRLLKGRVKNEAPAGSSKVDDAAFKALNAQKAKALVEKGYNYQYGETQDQVKAFECFKQAAELNDSDAHHYLGYCYGTGTGTNLDYTLAIKHYSLSQDHSTSCFNLGLLHENGQGCEKDYVKAAVFYQKALDMGYKKAALPLAKLYELGKGVNKDEKKAFGLVERAEDFWNKEASIKLGIYYYEGIGCTQDYTKALNLFNFNKNEAEACYFLGLMHLHGQGVQKNDKKAFELMIQAKNLGYLKANIELGYMYYYGIGTEKNDKEAYASMSAAYHPDNFRTNYWLGFFYMTGTGVEVDLKKAREYLDASMKLNSSVGKSAFERLELLELLQKEEDPENLFEKGNLIAKNGNPFDLAYLFFKKAAEKGHMQAQFNTGIHCQDDDDEAKKYFELAANQGDAASMCEVGKFEEDPKIAFDWFKKAAEKDLAKGHYHLGKSYEKGNGCVKDDDLALKHITLAAEMGYSEALSHLGLKYYFGSRLTPANYEKAFELMSKAYQKDSQDYFTLYWFGVFHMRGVGHDINTQKARELFDQGKAINLDFGWEEEYEELALWEALDKEEDPEKLFQSGLTFINKYNDLSFHCLTKATLKGHIEAKKAQIEMLLN